MTGTDSIQTKKTGDFTVGVVEGFYGMPWSAEQRKILFGWMQKMGLNTYMYAPKDDYKHRAHWRDLYSVEEADNLGSLIESAHEHGVTFVYAISPGLDISFSSSKDVMALKRKLEQVATFGCRAFALLFDDIEPELSEADRGVFSSFAFAQVSVANEVYEYLNQPKFLFCPTEYCASRAMPNVQSSMYLSTLGSKLLPGIDVMWTGCKVISKKITVQTLEEITRMLRRAPVIWDNIHANDYDPRRVYLGPYDGRSPDIIPYIRGVLSNPNCEFENNFVACHTLGQWSKSNLDGVKKDILNERLSPVAADIKLETESDLGSDDDITSHIGQPYKPRRALKLAIRDWLEEFKVTRHPPRRHVPLNLPLPFGVPPEVPSGMPSVAPPPPSLSSLSALATPLCLPIANGRPPISIPVPDIVKTCTITTPTTITPSTSLACGASGHMEILPHMPASTSITPCLDPTSGILANPSNLIPLSEPVNTLAQDCLPTELDNLSDSSTEMEAMECVPCSSSVTPTMASGARKADSVESLMQVEVCSNCDNKHENSLPELVPDPVTIDDICLLVDFFYLPFEYGSKSIYVLNSLNWLIENLHQVKRNRRDTDEFKAWETQADDFEKVVVATDRLLKRLFYSSNKSLLCSLHTYLWDLKSTLSVCLAYVKWLKNGLIPDVSALPSTKITTWFSEGYKEAFVSGDMEPWVFRGGLQHELQVHRHISAKRSVRGNKYAPLHARLLPLATAHDLFFIRPPDIIVPLTAQFRLYHSEDEEQIYDICLKTCDDGMDGTEVFPENPRLIGDRLVGRYLALSPEFCFVVEDEQGVYGYALGARDAKEFLACSQSSWVQAMCEKYPKPLKDDLSPAEEVMISFHGKMLEVPDEVYKCYPSVMRLDVLAHRMCDPAVPRRLLACILCALKAVGSYGVHVELSPGDKYMADFYVKLGFFPITTNAQNLSEEVVYMGRLF